MTPHQQIQALTKYYEDMATVITLLELLPMRSSSVSLNWGEDTGLWDCSVIRGGERLTATGQNIAEAVRALTQQIG